MSLTAIFSGFFCNFRSTFSLAVAMTRLTGILLFLTCFLPTFGQDRCGFDQVQQKMQLTNPGRNQVQFENWMRQRLAQRKSGAMRTAAGPYKIPVVIHVVHGGESVGTGVNLSDNQIASQLKVLNDDYKRLNADASNTPALFQSVAGSIDIEFVLARQDPEGLPTSGIVRVKGPKPGWTINDEFALKSVSYWPAEDYLNIWVANLTDSFLGYAQFPVSNLGGIDGPDDRLTDGVVIDYRAFGSVADGAFNLDPAFNRGRTATHELGHFLGLLHTFEGGCTGPNDYVTDTPPLSSETRGCPSHPAASCSGTKMFQNYLDYTDDVCMNLFTLGQIDRMVNVLENSPRRKSLLTSPGLVAPVLLTLDAEARTVVSPETVTCGNLIVPRVSVRNRGTVTITSLRMQLSVNGTIRETRDFTTNLASLASASFSFSAIDLAEPSSNNISFAIVSVNSQTDNNTANNTVAVASQVNTRLRAPLVETLNTLPANWTIKNPDNGITWTNQAAPAASPSNRAMYMNFFDYEQESYKDFFVSPFFDLTATPSAVLKFDVAYARFQARNGDSLRVRIYAGCSTSAGTTIYNKGGSGLATSNDTSLPFQPAGNNQWRTEVVPLTSFLGQNIRIEFEATNGYGNNLYLDNIQVVTDAVYDVAASSILAPAPVICNRSIRPELKVQNLGSANVDIITVQPTVNGVNSTAQVFSSLNLKSGGEAILALNPIALSDGENNVVFTVANPAVATDNEPANNTTAYMWTVNDAEERIPFRQRFDELNTWTLSSQTPAKDWEALTLATNPLLRYPGFTNTIRGEEAWLVSPLLDLTGITKASFFFDVSYGRRNTNSERLRVMVSEDCGESYREVLFDQSGSLLSVQNANAAWAPVTANDWRTEFVSINDYTGKSNVRLAFVATNDNGNNIYLDNIEFFQDDDPTPPKIENQFVVYSSDTNPFDLKVTFNLEEKQTARIALYNMMGQLLLDNELPETLNQTYTLDLSNESTGIYIARLQVGSTWQSFKMFVGR